MKPANIFNLLFFSFVLLLSSCEVIGDIFEAGVWVGIVIVVLVIAIIIWIIRKIF